MVLLEANIEKEKVFSYKSISLVEVCLLILALGYFVYLLYNAPNHDVYNITVDIKYFVAVSIMFGYTLWIIIYLFTHKIMPWFTPSDVELREPGNIEYIAIRIGICIFGFCLLQFYY